MKEMVERVALAARAMWDQCRLGDGGECVAFDGSRFKATSWRDFEGLARAAIEAADEQTGAKVTTEKGKTVMATSGFVLAYDEIVREFYQYEATEDQAVEAALSGSEVDNKPMMEHPGYPYPIRSPDPEERRAQREAEIRARLRQPVEET